MSRIDDERQAQMLAEKLALQKRQEEERTKDRRQQSNTFSTLVSKQIHEKAEGQKKQSVLSAAFEQARARAKDEKQFSADPTHRALEEALGQSAKQSTQAEGRARSRLYASMGDSENLHAKSAEGERSALGKASDQAQAGTASRSRQKDQISVELGSQGRREDQDKGGDGLSERGEKAAKASSARAGSPFDDDLRAAEDSGKGSGGQSGSQDGKKDGSELPQAFRLNPALMAPVAVAQPKTAPSSDKLRALANEIAQKIVERVRVGQNAAGKAEFQIDLKSTVLRGLSIKVSGGNGRISAVFQGSDKEVMKMLRDQEQSLRKALSGRGLALTEFRIEERS